MGEEGAAVGVVGCGGHNDEALDMRDFVLARAGHLLLMQEHRGQDDPPLMGCCSTFQRDIHGGERDDDGLEEIHWENQHSRQGQILRSIWGVGASLHRHSALVGLWYQRTVRTCYSFGSLGLCEFLNVE